MPIKATQPLTVSKLTGRTAARVDQVGIQGVSIRVDGEEIDTANAKFRSSYDLRIDGTAQTDGSLTVRFGGGIRVDPTDMGGGHVSATIAVKAGMTETQIADALEDALRAAAPVHYDPMNVPPG